MGHRKASKWARKKIRAALSAGKKKRRYFRFIFHSRYRVSLRCRKISRITQKLRKKLRKTQFSRHGGREVGDITIENHSIKVILKPEGNRLLVISVYENGVFP